MTGVSSSSLHHPLLSSPTLPPPLPPFSFQHIVHSCFHNFSFSLKQVDVAFLSTPALEIVVFDTSFYFNFLLVTIIIFLQRSCAKSSTLPTTVAHVGHLSSLL